MQVRPRLLFGSLAVSAVVSVAIGWAIAQQGDEPAGDTVVISGGDDTRATIELPNIDTNDDVEGTALPDAVVRTLDGEGVSVADWVGTPLVINLWGSTCVPCKEELPAFAAVHEQYGDDVRFVGISFLGNSEREEAFARDRGVQYELFYDSDGEFTTAAGVASFPVTLFVNAEGTIITQTGQLDEAELTRLVEELR